MSYTTKRFIEEAHKSKDATIYKNAVFHNEYEFKCINVHDGGRKVK
jgi:hypothetical protein